MKKKLENLLRDERFEKIALALKEPNIFESLKLKNKEIRHSNFLAWLLDPLENHGINEIFLKKVIREIFNDEKINNKTIFDADSINYNQVEVRREWKHLDLLVILENEVFVFENKIWHKDGFKQLTRYKRIAEEAFCGKEIFFVYLTPYGIDPIEIKARDTYINYSYHSIAKIIEQILCIYSENLNPRAKIYLEDYNSMLRRNILMSDVVNELSAKLYKNHKEALDFIFENKPDPISELFPYFEKALKKKNWVLGSKSKAYIRFIPSRLEKIIPSNMGNYWPGKEVFLFEFFVSEKTKDFVFKSVISPGNEEIRKKLHNGLSKSKFYKKNIGKQWIVNNSKKIPFDISLVLNEEEDFIISKIDELLKKVEPVVNDFTDQILKILK